MELSSLPKLSIREALQRFENSAHHWVRPQYLDWIADESANEKIDVLGVYYHDGDLHCDELAFDWGDMLLVNGDLIVAGEIATHDDTELMVLGDMRCRDFLSYCSAAIIGDLTVERYLVGDSQCELGTAVGGTIQAKFIANHANCFRAENVAAPFIFNQHHIETFDGNNNAAINGNVNTKTAQAIFTENFDVYNMSYALSSHLEAGVDPLKVNAESIMSKMLH